MFYSIVKQARILQACQKGIYEPIEVTFVPFLIHGLLLSNYCLYFYLKLGVLAASSQFFASFLPQGELENEICISTDLLYSELFCILEYIYSGKLMCAFEKKDEILKILKEYQVFVPDEIDFVEVEGVDQASSDGIDFYLEDVTEREEDQITLPHSQIIQSAARNTTLIQTFVVDEQEAHLKEVSVLTNTLTEPIQTFGHGTSSDIPVSAKRGSRIKKKESRSAQPVFQSERSNNFAKLDDMEGLIALTISRSSNGQGGDYHYQSGKYSLSGAHSPTLRSISPSAFITALPQKELSRNLQLSQERPSFLDINMSDDLMNKSLPNRNSVTLQIENDSLSASLSSDLGHVILHSTSDQRSQSPCNLPVYANDTWGYGVFSPYEHGVRQPVTEKPVSKPHPCALSYVNRRKQQPVFNIGTSQNPVLLSSKPQRVYKRKVFTNFSERKRIFQEKPPLNLAEIQNMITHKGKIHITVAGKPKNWNLSPSKVLHLNQASAPSPTPNSSDQELSLTEEESSNREMEASDIDMDYDFSLPDDSDVDTEEDRIDLALAQHYLREELSHRKKNQMKIRKCSKSLTQ